MRPALRYRRARHAVRDRDLQREYRQAVAIADELYRRWLDDTATYDGYVAARAATRDVWQEMQQ